MATSVGVNARTIPHPISKDLWWLPLASSRRARPLWYSGPWPASRPCPARPGPLWYPRTRPTSWCQPPLPSLTRWGTQGLGCWCQPPLPGPLWYPGPGCWCQPFLPGVAHTGLLLLLLLSAAAPSVLRRDAEAEGRARGVVLPGGVPRGELEVEEASCLSILQSSLTGGFVHPQAPRPRRRKGRENRRRRSELTVQETHSAGADWTVYISIAVLFSCPHLRTLFRSTSKPQRFKAHQWPPSWLSIVTTGF